VPALDEQVAQASSLVGLLLALDTLFTTEQARRLAEERTRTGGAKRSVLRATLLTCILLAAVTLAALVSLTPLAIDVLGTLGETDWQPVFGVFLLTYALLVGLVVWQVMLTVRARPR
jgi:ascorbate-specific PTS system EIIC-type component UlaA